MKLSTKGRYASRLMLDLALHDGEGFVLLKDVAARQEISRKYLGHLIAPLKTAGLIHASRGAHGGYRLAKPPGEILLADVVLAVEGKIAVVECVGEPRICHRYESCVTRDIWVRLGEKVMEVLNSVTLQDMIYQHREKQQLQAFMWHI
jgi:Rrf2 family protein